MPSDDFRSLGRDAQEALRSRAVHLVRELGYSQTAAALAIGASRQIVNQWVRRHAEAGDEGLLDGRRISPRKGRGLLTAREAERVQSWIRDKCPDQLRLPYMLWTAPVVREVIRRRLGKEPGESTIRLYLAGAPGVHAAETAGPGNSAFRRGDHAVAAPGLSGDRAAGEAGQGVDLLG